MVFIVSIDDAPERKTFLLVESSDPTPSEIEVTAGLPVGRAVSVSRRRHQHLPAP